MSTIYTLDIPKIFKCDLTGDYFHNCIMCECELSDGNTDYIIEKAIKPYDGFKTYATIFEYAMCFHCAESMKSVLSTDSKNNIEKFFIEKVDLLGHQRKFVENDIEGVEPRIENCIVTDEHVSTLAECQIYAQCIGTETVMHLFPYMVGGTALDSMIDLISAKTRDDLDQFKDNFLGGPPEFEELLKAGPRVFV